MLQPSKYRALLGRSLPALIMALLSMGRPSPTRADVPVDLDGGNIAHNLSRAQAQCKVLRTVGAGMCRIPVSPGDYGLETGQPRRERLDDLILLFEYYTRWHPELYGRDRRFVIGRAYAERFGPYRRWLTTKGIRNWGVRFYSAINEPTWKANNPTPSLLRNMPKPWRVWQNPEAWTRHPGATFMVQGVPPEAVRLSVYGWDGLRQSTRVNARSSTEVDQLSPGKTYMFLANGESL